MQQERLGLASRFARRPDIEWPWEHDAAEWKRAAQATVDHIMRDNVGMFSAALAFYAILALFPALISLISITSLLLDVSDVEQSINELSAIVPEAARIVLLRQLQQLLSTSHASLSIGFFASIAAALWSSSTGVDALIRAVNLAFDINDERGMIRRRVHSLLATLLMILLVGGVLALTALVPALVHALSGRSLLVALFNSARWPAMACLIWIGLSALYRYAPNRQIPPRWTVSGALVGTVGWLGVSALLSLYISTYTTYDRTYGALAGVVALLLWLYLSSFVVLVGAELSAQLDGTKGSIPPPPRPPDQSNA